MKARDGISDMTIKAKILMFVLACGAITLVVAGVGIGTLSAFNAAMVESRQAARRALDAANVNRLVSNVVLESRGVYAAKDTADAQKYADRMRQNLTAMNDLLAALGRRYLRERFGPKAARKAGQAVFHLPVDLVASFLGVHRTTVWRWAGWRAAACACSRPCCRWAVRSRPSRDRTGR